MDYEIEYEQGDGCGIVVEPADVQTGERTETEEGGQDA